MNVSLRTHLAGSGNGGFSLSPTPSPKIHRARDRADNSHPRQATAPSFPAPQRTKRSTPRQPTSATEKGLRNASPFLLETQGSVSVQVASTILSKGGEPISRNELTELEPAQPVGEGQGSFGRKGWALLERHQIRAYRHYNGYAQGLGLPAAQVWVWRHGSATRRDCLGASPRTKVLTSYTHRDGANFILKEKK